MEGMSLVLKSIMGGGIHSIMFNLIMNAINGLGVNKSNIV